MSTLKVFMIEDYGATAYVITDSVEKALEIAKRTVFDSGETELDVEELPMDKVLSIWMDDGRISDGGESVLRTCAEWIASQEEGLLCTSEF